MQDTIPIEWTILCWNWWLIVCFHNFEHCCKNVIKRINDLIFMSHKLFFIIFSKFRNNKCMCIFFLLLQPCNPHEWILIHERKKKGLLVWSLWLKFKDAKREGPHELFILILPTMFYYGYHVLSSYHSLESIGLLF